MAADAECALFISAAKQIETAGAAGQHAGRREAGTGHALAQL